MDNNKKSNCGNLPSKIKIGKKSADLIIEEGLTCLMNYFLFRDIYFLGKKVNTRRPYTQKQTYEHILKLDDPKASVETRQYRARIAPQIVPLLDNYENGKCKKCLKVWKKFDEERASYRYICYCKDNNLLMVFAEQTETLLMITAYRVTDKQGKKQIDEYNKSSHKIK